MAREVISSLNRIPDALLPALALLPRSLLNRIEVAALPGSLDALPDPVTLRQEARSFRWALLKQTIYPDLYCCPPGTPPAEAARSTLQRLGPAAFLTDFGADFWLVREDPAPECRAWEESVGSHPGTDLAEFRQRQHRIPHEGARGHRRTPWENSVPVEEIPFSRYDTVISVDIAVPDRILKTHPQILWATLPADPGTPTAKAGWKHPPGLWNVNLTHLHRRFPVRPSLGPRTVECPYSFQSRHTWETLFPENLGASAERRGCFLETQTYRALSSEQRARLEAFGPIRHPQGSLPDVARDLRASRYYVQLTGGPLTGNGQVEAVMDGCLAVGNPASYVQRSLFLPGLEAGSFSDLGSLLARLESDEELCRDLVAGQGRVAELVCFQRPAHRLLALLRAHRQNHPG